MEGCSWCVLLRTSTLRQGCQSGNRTTTASRQAPRPPSTPHRCALRGGSSPHHTPKNVLRIARRRPSPTLVDHTTLHRPDRSVPAWRAMARYGRLWRATAWRRRRRKQWRCRRGHRNSFAGVYSDVGGGKSCRVKPHYRLQVAEQGFCVIYQHLSGFSAEG